MTGPMVKNMFSHNWRPVLLFLCFVASRLDIILGDYENSNSQFFHNTRRILDGVFSEERSFMVYLLKAEESKVNYTDWLCGGTLVKDDFILTSAACVRDVEHMYVMAGTSHYIKHANDTRMEDNCLKCMRKKVIKKIHPDDYELSFEDTVKWSTNDIALLQVEEPFSKCPFKFGSKCDYRPWPIQIQVDGEISEDNLFTLGWGSDTGYRQSGKDEDKDVNSLILLETKVSALSKQDCKQTWGKKWHDLIDKSMICTLDKYMAKPTSPKKKAPRRGHSILSMKRHARAHTANDHIMRKNHQRSQYTHAGFCQNDHGGPLVDIRDNDQLIVVGVASACRITKQLKCVGPFLFTSTYKHRCLLLSALNMGTGEPCMNTTRRSGYITEIISWKNHPDGPAANERESTQNPQQC